MVEIDTKDILDKAGAKEEAKSLPSPRFDLITKAFDDIEEVIFQLDKKENLSIFELEIIMLMLRKKLEHLGLTAMFATEPEKKGHSDVYQ